VVLVLDLLAQQEGHAHDKAGHVLRQRRAHGKALVGPAARAPRQAGGRARAAAVQAGRDPAQPRAASALYAHCPCDLPRFCVRDGHARTLPYLFAVQVGYTPVKIDLTLCLCQFIFVFKLVILNQHVG